MLTEVICFTTSGGLCKSMSRLCILISKRSQVLDPSPQGVLRVVMGRVLVGRRTGPFTISFFSLAPLMSSVHTFSKLFTLRLVKVMRMRCTVVLPPELAFPCKQTSFVGQADVIQYL